MSSAPFTAGPPLPSTDTPVCLPPHPAVLRDIDWVRICDTPSTPTVSLATLAHFFHARIRATLPLPVRSRWAHAICAALRHTLLHGATLPALDAASIVFTRCGENLVPLLRTFPCQAITTVAIENHARSGTMRMDPGADSGATVADPRVLDTLRRGVRVIGSILFGDAGILGAEDPGDWIRWKTRNNSSPQSFVGLMTSLWTMSISMRAVDFLDQLAGHIQQEVRNDPSMGITESFVPFLKVLKTVGWVEFNFVAPFPVGPREWNLMVLAR